MLAAKVRIAALMLVIAWQVVESPETGLNYYYNLLEIFAFVVLGALQYVCASRQFYPRVLSYVFVVIDCLLIAVIFSTNSPFDGIVMPPSIMMETARFLYFFMFLMQAAFGFQPALVLWCGFWIVVARLGMWTWFINVPGAYTNFDLEEQSIEAFLVAGTDLNFLYLGYAATEIVVVVIVSAGLAVVVARSRSLAKNRISAERTRSSLARYFSPNVADRLSQSDAPFSMPRQQRVAVLFADIVGFTKLCETASPEDVIGLLREYHDRLGQSVFDNGGTLDKYIGDGLMATFGTPDPTPDDAAHALDCAFDMIDALEKWNTERQAAGIARVSVGIGIHYGLVVAGDIGNDRRLEYSVVGDAVNIASRLEHMTRRLGTPLAVSDDLVRSLEGSDGKNRRLLNRLKKVGEQDVRGRAAPVLVWTLAC